MSVSDHHMPEETFQFLNVNFTTKKTKADEADTAKDQFEGQTLLESVCPEAHDVHLCSKFFTPKLFWE